MPAGTVAMGGAGMSTSATVADAMAQGDQGKRRARAETAKKKKKGPGVYRVRSGDSLIAIAKEHGCDVSDLAKANRLRSPGYMIKPGQRLKLSGCED